MKRHLSIVGIVCFVVFAIFHPARAAAGPQSGAGANWAYHGGDADETGYSRLGDIDTANIGRLGLAWHLDLPGETTLEATPLAVDGTLYFTGSYAAVYAVDAVTGKLLWKHDPQTWKYNPAKMHFGLPVNRGIAYARGRIFAAALDGRLFALDANSGKLLWSVQTIDPQSPQTITGAPLEFDGKVIIGNVGADYGARGSVTAYDAATGRQVWRFYVAPGSPLQNKGDPAMERAAATWTGEYWKTGTGGAVWDNITFDGELNRIYIGTGNAGPWDPHLRSPGGGDNLYTASIVALDSGTGKYVWHYQLNPGDSWDFDATQRMTLADLAIDGKPRKVLMQAPKNGFFYVLDRVTGKPISAAKIGKVTWADRIDLGTGRPVEEKNIRYETGDLYIWPFPSGAHGWMDMSYDPKNGLVFIPYMQLGAHFTEGRPVPGGIFFGGLGLKDYESDRHDGKGALLAWSPLDEKPRWEVWHDSIWNGGTLATAGGLVFQGTADGYISAYDSPSGKRLWQFNAGLGAVAAPISYLAGGRQYISILVGYGGSASLWGEVTDAGWKFGAQPRRLLTFALGGKDKLPPSPPRDMVVHALDNPSIKLEPADVTAGHERFLFCAMCHGRNLVSAGSPAPDLRESRIALDPQAFWSVLHDGALLQQGMPRFDTLSREQAMQIWAYIREGAREALLANGVSKR